MDKKFLKDRIILTSLIFALLINLAIWLLLFLKIKPTDLPITLHYDVYFGVDYLGKYTKIYMIPAIGLIVFFINAILGNYIFPKSKIAARSLIIAIPVVQLLLAVSAAAIVVFNL